jgi:hypothetical protein
MYLSPFDGARNIISHRQVSWPVSSSSPLVCVHSRALSFSRLQLRLSLFVFARHKLYFLFLKTAKLHAVRLWSREIWSDLVCALGRRYFPPHILPMPSSTT